MSGSVYQMWSCSAAVECVTLKRVHDETFLILKTQKYFYSARKKRVGNVSVRFGHPYKPLIDGAWPVRERFEHSNSCSSQDVKSLPIRPPLGKKRHQISSRSRVKQQGGKHVCRVWFTNEVPLKLSLFLDSMQRFSDRKSVV